MSKIKNILNPAKYIVLVLGLIFIIGFANMKQADRYVTSVSVKIDNQYQNYFINENDVFDLINESGETYLLNNEYGSLDLKSIENKIKIHRFVEDAEVYHDLHGNLSIDIKQNRPIARVLINGEGDKYISTTGLILPESSHFTARVLLITLDENMYLPEDNMTFEVESSRLFELLKFVNEDEFWKAQIAGIHVNIDHELILQPQVTKQLIEFGKAEDIAEKFKKLKIFYKEILPYEGWNSYESVNLKYKNQIVCK
jgi:cell division protein FtsQ